MKIKMFVIIFILFILLISCEHKKKENFTAGVIFSFDDAYVDEWFFADSVLKKYNWKATFCVCKIDSIGGPQIKKLQMLQKKGHEIAGHGFHHLNAPQFLKKNGIDQYVKQEIDPMLASMKKDSFNITSFAYPFGERSDLLDKTLSNKFSIIRERAFCGNAPENEGYYFRNTQFVYAFDIDDSHIHFSIPYLLKLLEYAKKNNQILILCSHKPVKVVTKNYQTRIETIEFVCKYVKLNNMKFYTLSDLNNF